MRLRLVVIAVLTAVALAACSDDDRSGGSNDTGSSGSAEPDPTAAPPGDPVEFRPVLFSGVTPAPTCSGSAASCPPRQVRERFDGLDCSADSPPRASAPPEQPVAACAEPQDGPMLETKYALGPARIVGGVVEAGAEVPEGQLDWVVNLRLDESATAQFRDLSQELVESQGQVAILLDGLVISAPTVSGVIEDGLVQISGEFTQDSAESLAARLAGPGA